MPTIIFISSTSQAKIEVKDKNGLHFGMTSHNDDVPVAYGAHQTVNVPLNSFPEGGSDNAGFAIFAGS